MKRLAINAATIICSVLLQGCVTAAIQRPSGPEAGFLYGSIINETNPHGLVRVAAGMRFVVATTYGTGEYFWANTQPGTGYCIGDYLAGGESYQLHSAEEREKWCYTPKPGEFVWAGAYRIRKVKDQGLFSFGEYSIFKDEAVTRLSVLKGLRGTGALAGTGWSERIEKEVKRLEKLGR